MLDDELVLIRGKLRVVLHHIGEGFDGDYDQSDPEDAPLLRFDVERQNSDNEWEEVPDASYCTRLPATLSPAEKALALEKIMAELPQTGGMKRVCERLSWITKEDLR